MAQESARDQQPPEPVFRTEVNYVEVDAFVMDEQGEFLRNLTRDDFQVFEEGVLQEITAFAEISIPIERPEATFAESAPSPRDTATNERPFEGRVYVFVLDEAHTDPRRSGLARELASQFIEEQMAADDIAAVVITGDQPGAGQAFTSDKRLLLEAVARFTGRKLASATLERLNLIEFQSETIASQAREPGEPPVRGRDLDPSDSERAYNARKSMETLENVARVLGAARGRRKAILYFSEGIDFDTLDVMRRVQRDASVVLDSIEDAIATATRNNVAVYPIDPRGLISGLGPDDIQMRAPVNPSGADLDQRPAVSGMAATANPAGTQIDSLSLDREVQRSLDNLHTLAMETGGIAVLNTNDFETAYDSIVRANSQYYLMGYYPSDFRRDGAFRSIEVRVKRPGLTVVARDGYVRPSEEDEEERPRTRVADDTSPEVRELLDRPWGQAGLTLGVTAAAFKGTDEAASVIVTIQLAGLGLPFRQEGDRAVNEIEVSLLAIDHEGRPITDPSKVNEGALLPVGGAKGYALGLVVEILAGVATGAGIAHGVRSMYSDFENPGNSGHFFVAIDINALMPLDTFYERMEILVNAIRDCEGVLLPGEARWRAQAETEAAGGVALDEQTTAALAKLAESLKVPMPR